MVVLWSSSWESDGRYDEGIGRDPRVLSCDAAIGTVDACLNPYNAMKAETLAWLQSQRDARAAELRHARSMGALEEVLRMMPVPPGKVVMLERNRCGGKEHRNAFEPKDWKGYLRPDDRSEHHSLLVDNRGDLVVHKTVPGLDTYALVRCWSSRRDPMDKNWAFKAWEAGTLDARKQASYLKRFPSAVLLGSLGLAPEAKKGRRAKG